MNLKSIISEELDAFLSELEVPKEYTNDEIIDINRINLGYEYSKLNQLLFNNNLPNVPLKWDNGKKALGHVRSRYDNRTGQQQVLHLSMSKFYSETYRIFKNVLAHEMIHVKLAVNNEEGKGNVHGIPFHREASRINSMGLGFNITVKNTEPLNVGTSQKGKDVIALILELDGNFLVSVTSPKAYNTESQYFFNAFERMVNRGRYNNVEITAVETDNPELKKYTNMRSLAGSLKAGKIDDDLLEELLDDKIIKSVRFKKGEPAKVMVEDKNSEIFDIV